MDIVHSIIYILHFINVNLIVYNVLMKTLALNGVLITIHRFNFIMIVHQISIMINHNYYAWNVHLCAKHVKLIV